MQALVDPTKPKASPLIAIDQEAYAQHQADIEVWGFERWLAGGRICRWLVKMGAPYDFCPPKPAGESDDEPR